MIENLRTMATSSSELKKPESGSAAAAAAAKRVTGQRHFSDPTEHANTDHHHHTHHSQDPDLFSILSSMHLTNHIQTNTTATAVTMPHPVLVASRKRKILDGGVTFSGGGSGKINGMRHPAHRRGSDDDDIEAPLQTPQCSQSGIDSFPFCQNKS